MGKHTKPKINYRAALLVGAAPIAMLLASPGISSAAQSIDIGGAKITPDLDRGHTVTHNGGVTNYKDFVSGYVDAMNSKSDTMPLGTDGAANYATSQHGNTGGELGSTNSFGNGTFANSSYARGHAAGSNDLAGGLHYGDYGFSGSDSSAVSGNAGMTPKVSYGPGGAVNGSSAGTVNGSASHATGSTTDLGSGRSVRTNSSQNFTGSASNETHGGFDPRTGTGRAGGSANGSMAGANSLGGDLGLGGGNHAGANGTQSLAGSLGGTNNTVADKNGNASTRTSGNATMTGGNSLSGGGSFGPGHGSLSSKQTGTISGVLDGSAGRSGGKDAMANGGTISGVFGNDNSGSFGIDHVIDAGVDSHQKMAASGTASGSGSVNEKDPAGSSATLNAARNLAGSDHTTGKLSVLDLVHVSGGEQTGVTQRGSEGASTSGVSTPKENGNLTHSNNLEVGIAGMKPVGGGLDLSVSPLKVKPHLNGGPLGNVNLG